jgi:hypothetical protein
VVLVAVRWESIPDGVKLSALAAVSGGLLLVGRRGATPLARRVPAAAGVLFHLGAFLCPVTVAAVLVHLSVPRDQLLLVLGAGSALLFHVLGRLEDSVVLRWGAAAAVVVATTGLGGLTPVPATGWLVVLAGLALVDRRGTAAGAWALVAGFAPFVGLAADGGLSSFARDTVVDAVGTGLTPAIVGLGAAAVLAVVAHQRRALPLVALSGMALTGGVAAAWHDLEPSPGTATIAAAAAFVLVEAAALLVRRDPFWASPVRGTALMAEVLAIPTVLGTVVTTLLVEAGPSTAVACMLSAVAWLVADLRRVEGDADAPALGAFLGGSWWPGTVAASISILGVIAAGTGSSLATGGAALALAAVLVVSGRAGSAGLVPVLASAAPLYVADEPWAVAALGVAGALLVAGQAALHRPDAADPLTVVAPLPALVAGAVLVTQVPLVGLLVAGLALLWAQAAIVDRGRAHAHLGDVPRAFTLAVLTAGVTLPAGELAVLGAAFTVIHTLDLVRRGDARLAWAWTIGVPIVVGATAVAVDVEPALPLTLAAVPFALVTLRLGALRPATSATALVLAGAGLATAASDPRSLGTVLLLDGVLVLAAGLRIERPELVVLGGLSAVAGTWQHLSLGGVESVDAYALPVAVLLWVVGARLAEAGTTSWVTHGPAIALAGGTALAERLADGGGAHALLAGLVGLVAVIEGGGRRLAAPLLLGTGVLVALTVHETTAVTAGVPTWAWLATGGALLVGAGLTMERHQLGPVETGRRLVDVVNEHFD